MSAESIERRIETKPSQTAKMVCYIRAFGFREVGPPIARDHLAELFLSPKMRAQVADDGLRAALLQHDDFQTANYSYLTARTRHLDRVFEDAIAKGIEQIVLLGAGYDSRCYRFAQALGAVPMFEVDAPTTQAAKRRYLDLAEIDVPAQVTFVPINFNDERLEDVLAEAGYAADKRTLFIWEGVTYYISAEAVTNTLNFIRSQSAQGSIVAFDYIYAPVARQEFNYHGAQAAYEAVARQGEPFVFGIAEGAIEPFLREHGFDLVEHFTPAQFQASYLDSRFAPMYGFMLNAVALVA